MISFFYPGPNMGGYHIVRDNGKQIRSACRMVLDRGKYLDMLTTDEPELPETCCPVCSNNASKFLVDEAIAFRRSTRKVKKENAGGDEVYQQGFSLGK